MLKQAQHLYEFGPYRLNPAQQLLTEGSKKIPLTPKAFQTLLVLVENRDRVVEKEELLQKIWPNTFVEQATLAQNIFTLRKQLQDDGGEAAYIETVPRRGYRFVAAVRLDEPPRPTPKAEPIASQIPPIPAKRKVSPYAICFAAIVLIVGAAILYWRTHPIHSAV